MNGIRYTVNSENKEIDIEQAPETEWKLSFKQSKMIAAFVITVFFAALYIV